jgi:transaldolase
MKIFLDTADVDAIRRAHETGLLDGVTTNPTHLMKTGRGFLEIVEEITQITSGSVSAEAVGHATEELVEEGIKIAKIAHLILARTTAGARGAVCQSTGR